MKNNALRMPANYAAIQTSEQEQVVGGGSFISFIAYLLSNFNVSFGSGTVHTNSDTVSSSSGSYGTQHSNVDNVTSRDHISWDANINLGGLFRALVRLLY